MTDFARAKEIMARFDAAAMAEARPDVLASVLIGHDEGRWTQVIYFTSEAEARESERREPPPEFRAMMDELMAISVGEPTFLDLRDADPPVGRPRCRRSAAARGVRGRDQEPDPDRPAVIAVSFRNPRCAGRP